MSRGLIPIFTVVAAAVLVWSAVSSGPEMVAAIHAQLDGQLARSSLAFRTAAAGADLRALVVADESSRNGGLVRAMEGLSRRGSRPDQQALDVATGAVAARAELRGEAERTAFLGLANERGAVESRTGEPAKFEGTTLPLADSALAGIGKATWAIFDDKLVHVVAAPIGELERPEGALVLGYAVDDKFVAAIKAEIGTDITIVQGGKVIASSLPPAERSQLASVASGAGAKAFSFGSVPANFSFLGASLPLGGPDVKTLRGQAFPIPGGEGATAVFSAEAGTVLAPVAAAQKRALGAALFLVVVGITFTVLNRRSAGGAEARELAEAAEALVVGDMTLRAPDYLRGDMGRIADALNRLFARRSAEKELATRTQAADAAVAKVLERQKTGELTLSPAPEPEATATREALATTGSGRSLRWEGFSAAPTPTPTPTPSKSPSVAEVSAGPRFDLSPGPSSWDRSPGAISAGGDATRASEKDFDGLLERGAASSATPGPEAFNPEATLVAAVPEVLLRATSRTPARPVVASPVSPTDPDEAHFEQVFRDFVATRERCGESTDGLTFDRFAVKLRKNREQLVEKYHCRSVRFTVYVKEGKAALKAAPVKD